MHIIIVIWFILWFLMDDWGLLHWKSNQRNYSELFFLNSCQDLLLSLSLSLSLSYLLSFSSLLFLSFSIVFLIFISCFIYSSFFLFLWSSISFFSWWWSSSLIIFMIVILGIFIWYQITSITTRESPPYTNIKSNLKRITWLIDFI